ncbi:thiol-disulfide oxidoreductase [Acinetobacter sp. ANC 5054]|uniref:thiol-disulfide oxidoreductase DCC family protein n=1 Tax=Acinetobacter sp. ANC 5054 TaxID=1977877 RepID=UPI000A354167|nr:DCC1-like thiol-disulfide oxidoreductase family protein [Acinetobacter sp. ANC 5054]OTG84296.1 thiol-disulfide oxidoreductase [Acinetobacter sp. ANC 5054]
MTQDIKVLIQDHDIILYDAVCVICSGWAKFLIKYDKSIQFKLVSAQSPLGVQLLEHYQMSTELYTTMVVVKDQVLYTESTALLKVMQHLGLPFSLMNFGYLMPRPIRDFLYRRVALNRYALFGTTNQCLIPSAENRKHFLEYALHDV